MKAPQNIVSLSLGLILLALVTGGIAQTDSRAERRERQRKCRAWLRDAAEYQANGKYAEAIVAADSALGCDERNPDAYYIIGTMQARLADTVAAKTALRTGIKQAPLSARLKLQLARLCALTGEREAADSLIDATLAYKPREPEALYLKARSQLYHGDTTSALDLFERALSISLKKNGE